MSAASNRYAARSQDRYAKKFPQKLHDGARLSPSVVLPAPLRPTIAACKIHNENGYVRAQEQQAGGWRPSRADESAGRAHGVIGEMAHAKARHQRPKLPRR